MVKRKDDKDYIFKRRYYDYSRSINDTLDVLRIKKIPEFFIDPTQDIDSVVESIKSIIVKI